MSLKIKEPVNTWTHLISFVAAIVGLVFLIIMSKNNIPKLAVMTIYGLSLIFLYGASSIYHGVRTTPQKVLFLKKIDHIAIYFLIAGSYTPVLYYGLEGAWRWAMLILVWSLALTGMALKIWFIHAPRYFSVGLYLSLGWIVLIPFKEIIRNFSLGAIILMAVGGVLYTLGAFIYATKIFNFFPKRFGFHEIFHLFITAGSIVHFVMMLICIVPLKG
jgi:hemolysin III